VGSVYRARLKDEAEEKASRFTTSIREDERIFEEDIYGTEAHDIMLHEQSIISKEELKKILAALEKLRLRKQKGKISLDPKYEDIHEFVESYIIGEAGLEIGGKLHTGRSRNDQVALDIRMRLRADLNEISGSLLSLIETLLRRAEEHKKTPMVLYTHTQHAQIGSLSHYLLAYTDIFLRDCQRLSDCYCRVNLNPLGAGPVGGISIPVDRERTTSLLGFEGVVENTIDATSSRDFMLEPASTLAILMSGLSRMAEDLILWSSAEFGYVEIDDRYASISSIMPQKKNPTVLELIRGKTGKVYGDLVSLLTMVKGLPTGYSSDLQETKPPLWDSLDAAKGSLEVLNGVVATMKVNEERLAEASSESYAFAVDLAEHLAAKTGLSFREAHMVVGNLVREMISAGIRPKDLKPKAVEAAAEKTLGKKVAVDVTLLKGVTDTEKVLKGRKPIGSPSPKETERMLKARRETLKEHQTKLADRMERLRQAKKRLAETVKKYS